MVPARPRLGWPARGAPRGPYAMKPSWLWLCTLTAATSVATIPGARALGVHGSGGPHLAHVVAGPEQHAPGPVIVRPAPPPSGSYNFSGNSFNLSVTRHGRPPGAP